MRVVGLLRVIGGFFFCSLFFARSFFVLCIRFQRLENRNWAGNGCLL